MKTLKLLPFLSLLILLFPFNGKAQDAKSEITSSTNKIEVIDFHSTHRCKTCNTIEANTIYTLDTFFAKELKSGKIVFSTVNIDEKQNYNIAEKFEASGTALFLNVIIDGNETQIDLTNFAFLKGKNKDVFSKELKSKIETQLQKL